MDAHSGRPTTGSAAADTGPLGPAGVRALKIAIAVMGLMIVLGVLAVIGRIFYLASSKRTQTPQAVQSIAPEATLALPEGASVRSISLAGNRLAVHYAAPTGEGIAVVDLQTGRTVSQVSVASTPARP